MAKVTGEGAHGHVYQEDDTGVIVAGWCLGDQPWRPESSPPLTSGHTSSSAMTRIAHTRVATTR